MVYERKKAYTEVYLVLQYLPKEYTLKIPSNIINIFQEQQLHDYIIDIDEKNPIDRNKLSDMSLAILAALNYRYWCPNEKIKGELFRNYISNNTKYQKKIEQKYNINTKFNNKINSANEVINKHNENAQLVEYKENILKKILGFFKRIFKK